MKYLASGVVVIKKASIRTPVQRELVHLKTLYIYKYVFTWTRLTLLKIIGNEIIEEVITLTNSACHKSNLNKNPQGGN